MKAIISVLVTEPRDGRVAERHVGESGSKGQKVETLAWRARLARRGALRNLQTLQVVDFDIHDCVYTAERYYQTTTDMIK